jgi:hypothetical protein
MSIFKPIEINNFVDYEYQKAIYQYLTDIKFDWHFMEDSTTVYSNTPEISTPAFGNLLYYYDQTENPHFKFIEPLVNTINEKTNLKIVDLLRVRAGFLLNTKYSLPSMPYRYNIPHKDFHTDHYVAVYYVNKSDGDTVVFHELEQSEKYYPMHKCTPEQGKLLIFNGAHYHSSTCPKVHTKRLAITINFKATHHE